MILVKESKSAMLFPGINFLELGIFEKVNNLGGITAEIINEMIEKSGWGRKVFMFDSEKKLHSSYLIQPMTVACIWAIVKKLDLLEKLQPDFVAGHSMGEWLAVIASGAISFSKLIVPIIRQAQLMDEATIRGKYGMGAVMGLNIRSIESLCSQIGKLEISIENGPQSFAISGSCGSLQNLQEILLERYDNRKVRYFSIFNSGPFHSSFLSGVIIPMRKILEKVNFSTTTISLVSNYNGNIITDRNEIIDGLLYWVDHRLKWQSVLETLLNNGTRTFYTICPNCGFQKMVQRIIREIRPDLSVKVTNIFWPEDLEKVGGGEK